MKNKEIEELLNELKEATNSKKLSSTYCITNKHWQLLLSYIEQLEKRNKQIYEGFMATQEELTDYAMKNEQLEADYKEANDSITWWTNRYNALNKEYKLLKDRNEINIDRNIEAYRIVEQLENNRDKAIEYIEIELSQGGERELRDLVDGYEVLKLLKGDNNE